MKKLVFFVALCLVVAGCADNKKMAPKEGRIAIRSRAVDEAELKNTSSQIHLDQGVRISEWAQAGYNAQNKIPHSDFKMIGQEVWSASIGEGVSEDCFILTEPVVVNTVIYAVDSELVVTARSLKNGKELWESELPFADKENIQSVGLTYGDDRLFVVSGTGTLYALDLKGKLLYQIQTDAVLRSAPVVYEGQIYLLSAKNELIVLDAKDGHEKWRYKTMETSTNLLGMGRVAVQDDVVVVPFSNGEIVGLDTKTGVMRWSNTLLSYRMFNQIMDLTHVLASPVIENNLVYLIGNANRMGAFNLKTGEPVFVKELGGQNTPVVVGNAVLMVSNKNTLVAMDKKTGSFIWETPLVSKEDEKAVWRGPVLADQTAILVSSLGDVLGVDLKSGEKKIHFMTDELSLTPIFAQELMLILTNDADLIAYQ